ncbi:unnamed protein product [Amoebophrya sp. A25]|nr:unnamed protein product [Amoebophrya sp. A25]|eukprot:GSA25T00009330001.1
MTSPTSTSLKKMFFWRRLIFVAVSFFCSTILVCLHGKMVARALFPPENLYRNHLYTEALEHYRAREVVMRTTGTRTPVTPSRRLLLSHEGAASTLEGTTTRGGPSEDSAGRRLATSSGYVGTSEDSSGRSLDTSSSNVGTSEASRTSTTREAPAAATTPGAEESAERYVKSLRFVPHFPEERVVGVDEAPLVARGGAAERERNRDEASLVADGGTAKNTNIRGGRGGRGVDEEGGRDITTRTGGFLSEDAGYDRRRRAQQAQEQRNHHAPRAVPWPSCEQQEEELPYSTLPRTTARVDTTTTSSSPSAPPVLLFMDEDTDPNDLNVDSLFSQFVGPPLPPLLQVYAYWQFFGVSLLGGFIGCFSLFLIGIVAPLVNSPCMLDRVGRHCQAPTYGRSGKPQQNQQHLEVLASSSKMKSLVGNSVLRSPRPPIRSVVRSSVGQHLDGAELFLRVLLAVIYVLGIAFAIGLFILSGRQRELLDFPRTTGFGFFVWFFRELHYEEQEKLSPEAGVTLTAAVSVIQLLLTWNSSLFLRKSTARGTGTLISTSGVVRPSKRTQGQSREAGSGRGREDLFCGPSSSEQEQEYDAEPLTAGEQLHVARPGQQDLLLEEDGEIAFLAAPGDENGNVGVTSGTTANNDEACCLVTSSSTDDEEDAAAPLPHEDDEELSTTRQEQEDHSTTIRTHNKMVQLRNYTKQVLQEPGQVGMNKSSSCSISICPLHAPCRALKKDEPTASAPQRHEDAAMTREPSRPFLEEKISQQVVQQLVSSVQEGIRRELLSPDLGKKELQEQV